MSSPCTRLALAALVSTGLSAVALDAQSGVPGSTVSTADWYVFDAKATPDAGAIGMADWLEKPAGKHGRVVAKDDVLLYNGKPIRFWGVNLCYAATNPEKAVADRRAALLAKYGINSVRLHKYASGTGWAGIQSKDSAAEFDPAALDRFDYQVAKFKEAGIYVKISPSFGTIEAGPADLDVVPYAEEFGKFGGKKNRVGGGNSTLYYSKEFQDLTIQQVLNLLQHRNPYTGLTYAEDPVVAVLEHVNESSILFFTSMNPLRQSPTLRTRIGERFSAWLKTKYGSHEGLVKAWGEKALNSFGADGFLKEGEHLDAANILPLGNPWYWSPENLHGSQAFRKQRLLDSLEFLKLLQDEANARWLKAVRDAGYTGEVIASNWQAGTAYSHYANLHSDALLGTIDRHNYFSVSRPGGKRDKNFTVTSMLRSPGSGSFSAGHQQVGNRPFMLSEWIHSYPHPLGPEGLAIIGAYGLGLQGWDVSYLFQNGDNNANFLARLGGDTWEGMAPNMIGLFPAIARQVLRGDVKEATVLAKRRVHVPSLFQAKIGFDDTVEQGYDDKEFNSDKVPSPALAVARTVVEFTDRYEETPAFDLTPYTKNGRLVASTDQLVWQPGDAKNPQSGWFTMNTPGTKAVVGFAKDVPADLGGLRITVGNEFAAVYVTAGEPDRTLADTRSALVVAVGRAANADADFGPEGNTMVNRGKGPVRMEPVKVRLDLGKRPAKAVHILDQNGLPTGKTLPIEGGAVTIDTGRDATPYYRIEY